MTISQQIMNNHQTPDDQHISIIPLAVPANRVAALQRHVSLAKTCHHRPVTPGKFTFSCKPIPKRRTCCHHRIPEMISTPATVHCPSLPISRQLGRIIARLAKSFRIRTDCETLTLCGDRVMIAVQEAFEVK